MDATDEERESLFIRMEALESRLSVLEKKDREKISEISSLKKENLTLKQETAHLKEAERKKNKLETKNRKDVEAMLGKERDLRDRLDQLQDTVTKANEAIWKELGKVESIQKVFNRMLVNGHRNDLEDKVSRLERKLAMMRSEKSQVQKQELEEKIVSVVRAKLSNWTGFQLSVDPRMGEKISVDVDPTYTVARLKSLIQAKLGVSPRFQVLTFGTTTAVDDDNTLDDLGVDESSEIGLTVREMYVWISQGKGKKITVDVKPTHSIAMLKSLIKARTGVSPFYHRLTFSNSALTDDDKTLENLQIDDGSEIVLTVKESVWDVIVTTEYGQKTKVGVTFKTDVLTTIHMSHHQMGIPLNSHKALAFNNQVLDETKLLVEYGIKHDSKLTLLVDAVMAKSREQGMRILVAGHQLNVYPSTSVLQVRCLVQPQSESHPDLVQVCFQGSYLIYNKKLSYHGITDLCCIELSSSTDSPRGTTVKVTVTKLSDRNSKYEVRMDYWNTLKDLKGLMQDHWAIPYHKQTLVLKGIDLQCRDRLGMGMPSACFKSVISFSDPTTLTSIVLDPRVTPDVRSAVGQVVKSVYRDFNIRNEISQTFAVPYQRNWNYCTSYFKWCDMPKNCIHNIDNVKFILV